MSTDASRWARVREVFQATLDRPQADRATFLHEACPDDSDLRREVESLLDAHVAAVGHFMEPPTIELGAGTFLGPYEIVALLGTGGMGEVYRARDPRLNRDVALKILPPEFALDRNRLERFEREVRAVAALNHPNIVTIHSVEAIDGSRFFTMELVTGKTLTQTIQQGGLPATRILEIAIPLADAISAAHDHGIVHRDLKPGNVMLTFDGRVKVLDFGLAKLRDPEHVRGGSAIPTSELTGDGHILGTVAYMSPEQAEGKSVDHRSDIFSIGIILYELATGERPFTGDSDLAILSSIMKDAPKPITSVNPSMPSDLARIVRRCLTKEMARRYQTAADLRNELEELQNDLIAGDLVDAATRSKQPGRPWVVRSGIVTLSALVGFLGWYAASRQRGDGGTPLIPINFTRVTAEPGVEDYPTLPPDGKWIAYSVGDFDGAGEPPSIYLRRVGGQNAMKLTKDLIEGGSQPAFSPDGNRIAFRVGGFPAGGIYVMGLTGESPRRVVQKGGNPAWSPDGLELAYATQDVFNNPAIRPGTSQLWIVTLATGQTRRLTTIDAVQPAWSPHGRRIAFWGLANQRQGDIFSVAVSGGDAVPVTSDDAFDWNPVWSPDGRYLYFSSNRGGSFNLWRVRIDEGSGKTLSQPEPVTMPSAYLGHFSFSGDGRQIAYASIDRTHNIQKASFDPSSGAVTTTPEWITTGSRTWFQPHPSPDNQWLAFISGVEQNADLFVARTDGSSLRQLTNDPATDRFPRLSPDGQRIAFNSSRSGQSQVWTASPDGGALRPLTNYSRRLSWPAWSPDGSRMAVSDIDESRVLTFDPNREWGAQVPQAESFPVGEQFSAIAWSPDGEWLVGFDRPHAPHPKLGLAVYSLKSRAYEWLVEYWGGYVSWLNDSRRLVFASNDGKLLLIDRQSKKIHEVLSTPGERLDDPALSRDNRTIYFARARMESD